MRIIFFIESLRSGGKERRLLELLHYLGKHTDYEMILAIIEDEIHYKYVTNLDVDIRILRRRFFKKDPLLFFRFFCLCNEFNPQIIHTWGGMPAFYALPVVILKKVIHVNSQIADAPDHIKKHGFQNWVTHLNFRYSDIVLANSNAGLRSYNVHGKKCRTIYNGIRLERFSNLPDKEAVKAEFNIRTVYAVIMVASFSINKNYDQFLDIAEFFSGKRKDVTFVGVGGPLGTANEFDRIKNRAAKLDNVIMTGSIENTESLINACDIGVLFSFSEGISNSIIEYMACGKAVIANDAGGTGEILTNGETGFLLTKETKEEIASLIIYLLENEEKRREMGANARLHVEKNFSIDRMGSDFVKLYTEILQDKGK